MKNVFNVKAVNCLLKSFTIRKTFLFPSLFFIGINSSFLNAQTNLCVGGTAQMSYVGSGGSWVSNNAAVATVSSGGLVTASGSGSTTVNYQTASTTATSLFWGFESGATNPSAGIWSYTPTTTSNPSLLTGFVTQTGNGTYENLNWAPGAPGMVACQRQNPAFYTYIQFTTNGSSTVNNVSFAKFHNNNSCCAGTSYQMKLQISISGGTWTDVGAVMTCTAATMGSVQTITINTAVPAGTHKIRWVRVTGSNGGDYFCINNVTLNCLSASSNVLNSNTINVLSIPSQPSAITTPASICLNSAGTYSVTNVAGVTYSWSYSGAGTITGTGNSISLTPTTDGTLTVTPSNSCGSGTARTFAISFLPLSAGVHDTSPLSLCAGANPSALTFTTPISGGTTPYTYQWQLNGSSIPGGITNSYDPPILTAGSYSYNCKITDACGAIVYTSPKDITVNPIPTINTTTPASICGTGTVDLGATTASGTLNWYAAASGGVSLGTGTSYTTPSISATTTYYVDVMLNGCTSARTAVTATINSVPLAATNAPIAISTQVLVVAGGGGGGHRHAGGGGAGGYISQLNFGVSPGSYSVAVGAGGNGSAVGQVTAANGLNSTFSTITAIGGGGGSSNTSIAGNGGSGGGGSNGVLGGTGIVGQGNDGGDQNNGNGCCYNNGGGGGGAGAAGANTTGAVSSAGGVGLSNSITGVATFYCGGGGGGINTATALSGGNGGGGAGGDSSPMTGIAGTANTGGGGGGGGANGGNSGNGGNGGSGIVIIKYLGTPVATGGTITQVGGYTIHKFTASGTFAYTYSGASAVVPNMTACGASAVTFTGTVTAGLTLDWYDAASGGNLLSSGTTSYTTPIISTTTTYYVAVRNSSTGCVSATRLAVTATINALSTLTANQTICIGGIPADIAVTGASGTIQWQSSANNSTFTNLSGQTGAILSGATIGALNATMYYRATIDACVGISPVHTVSVSNPTINSIPASICGTGTVDLGATTASGTLNWYAAASGGGSLGTGNSYTTPSISATTTYYVDVTLNGCTSARTAVTAIINTVPLAATNSLFTEILVVAGAGGGGRRHAGGGGAGGYISQLNFVVNPGTYSVAVGAGGNGSVTDNVSGTNGSNSSFSTYTAIGGGGGRSMAGLALTGGSGGGGVNGSFGGLGTAGQGNKGGDQNNGIYVGGMPHSCGGGGAGAAGANTTGQVSSPGGIGLSNSITGVATFYCGGGGGGINTTVAMTGGNGGGGAGGVSTSMTGIGGTINTGGGGGGGGASGSNSGNGGNGGSGIVVIKYFGTPVATGGTITQIAGYTIHKFTTSGTFALTGAGSNATVPNMTACGTSAVTFTGTISAGLTLDWYDAAVGGNLLSAGTSTFTTPIISSTTTYYVAVRNTSTDCVSATRLAVIAAINSASTLTANQTICMGEMPANIAVTSASGTIQWQSSTNNSTFTDLSGQTGATLTGAAIGAIYAAMYYRAVITNGACVGNSPVHAVTVSNPIISASPVSTDLVWLGKVSANWTNASNWLSYNGTNYGLAVVIPSSTANVFIQAASSCVLNQPTIVSEAGLTQNMTIEAGATLTMNSGSLAVAGNWIKNGSFIPGNGTATFNGAGAQSIYGVGATSFTNLIVDNSSSGLSLLTPIDVTGSLTMTAGNILTSSLNILTLGVGSVGTLNWTAGTIVGPFKRWYSATTNSGNSSGLFPVGTVTDNRWTLLEYTSAPTTAGYLSAEFKAVNPMTTSAASIGLPLLDQYNWTVDNISTDGYWEIIPTTIIGGTYNLKVRPKTFNSITNTFDVCRIIKSPNAHSTWTLNGTHGTTTGNQADFTISRTGMSGFSYFAIGFPTIAPLPIELISFQANCTNDNTALISWSTASEHNSSYFEIDKSRDGVNWTVLSDISGAGNSTSIINYQLLDTEKVNEVNYYRLTQFDLDGASETFNIAIVNCGMNELSEALKVYPNPSSEAFYVEYTNESIENQLEIKVIDLKGEIIYLEKAHCVKGKNTYHIMPLQVSPGIYFLEVKAGETISRIKHSLR
jgi:hypothetical protein